MSKENLINFTSCCEILGVDFSWLQFYKRTGRFVKPTVIDGVSFYDKEKVAKWKPINKKAGRPKKEKNTKQ